MSIFCLSQLRKPPPLWKAYAPGEVENSFAGERGGPVWGRSEPPKSNGWRSGKRAFVTEPIQKGSLQGAGGLEMGRKAALKKFFSNNISTHASNYQCALGDHFDINMIPPPPPRLSQTGSVTSAPFE